MALSLGSLIILLVFLRRKFSRAYLLCLSLFWLYLMLLASLILFPVPIFEASFPRQPLMDMLSRVNLIPLDFGYLFHANHNTIFEQLIGNILLTLPLGFGLPFIGAFKPGRLFWLAVGSGFAIEMLQFAACLLLGSDYRGIDINDALLNSLGTLLGYAFFRGFARLYLLLMNQRIKTRNGGLLSYIDQVALHGSATPEIRLKSQPRNSFF
jgi:glycopeptide antibiotics resistance protein